MEREDYNVNGFEFKYRRYKYIERKDLIKLTKKVRVIQKFTDSLHEVLFCEKYNRQKQRKDKTPNYYIAAIKKRISELEEDLKEYEEKL